MSQPSKSVQRVRSIRLASPKKTLILEAEPDRKVYEFWLGQLASGLPAALSKVDLISLGGKNEVLNTLAWFRDSEDNPADLFGLVDRDEWDGATIASQIHDLPQLRINPNRHTLESYFCDPREIRPALESLMPGLNRGRLDSLVVEMRSALAHRVDHWCLFTVTERVKNRMNEAQYPGVFHDQYVLPSDREVRKRLRSWASIVKSTDIFEEFDGLRSASRLRPESEQFRSCVWAKPFYEQVVYASASGLQSLRGTSYSTWMIDLATNMSVPADLSGIFSEFLE